MKRIAVIICFHNAGGFLREALLSLEFQTYRDWYCYLFDDGSTDEGGPIARQFADKHATQCECVRSVRNIGKARGISALEIMVNQPYLTFLDADDTIAPTALEACVNALDSNPDVEVVVTACRSMDVNGIPGDEWRWRHEPYSDKALRAGRVSPALMVLRTDPFMDAGAIDVAFRQGQMYELRLRMAERRPFMVLPDVLYNYRRHDGQVSVRNREAQGEAIRRAREKHPRKT